MKLFIFLNIFFLALSSQAIVGGELVEEKDLAARSTVGLSNGCTGTLIDDRLVLTAAHCLANVSSLDVVFGLSFSKASRVAVERLAVHEGYGGFTSGSHPDNPAQRPIHDIALLYLAESAPQGFEPAILGLEKELVEGDGLLLAGFGQTNPFTGAGFGVLRQVKTLFNFYNDKAMEIVFGPTPGKSACRGDSGGPMYYEQNNQLHVIGVTSRGFTALGPCSGNGNYTDVEAHRDWIENAVAELE